MPYKGRGKLIVLLTGGTILGFSATEAQPPNPSRDVSEPGVYGVRIHPGAMAPTDGSCDVNSYAGPRLQGDGHVSHGPGSSKRE